MDEGLEPALSQEEQKEKEARIKKLAPLAKDVVMVLVKTIKATKMYLPNNPIYQKFREELKDKFDIYFKDEDYLSFLVKRFDLTFLDQLVYQNPDKEDNIALMFFKDGIREFCFHRGITPVEIDGFINILKFDARDRELDDDLVTLLWEKDFDHITYTVADEATDEEADEEEALLSFDEEPDAIKQLEELQARAIKEGESAPGDLGGVGHELSAGEALGVLSGWKDEEDYESLRGSYPAPDELSLLTELTDIFYEILLTEDDAERFEMVSESMSKALDIFVGRGDLALATIIVMKVQELASDPRLSERKPTIEKIIDRACSEPIIKKVGEYISQGGQESMEAAGSYLSQLDSRALGPMVGLLESLESRKARKAVCDIIAAQCGENGKPLAPYLKHRFWYVVRNIAMVMAKVSDQETVPALGESARHEDPRVRKEALNALAALKGKKAEDILADSLSDHDRQVRAHSGRLLVELAPGRAYDTLTGLVSQKAFEEREFDEKKEVFELIGRSGGEKAVPFLVERFQKKGFFGGNKRDRLRACAAYGLAATGGKEAYELLRGKIDSKSKVVRAACLDGLKRMGK